VKEESMAAPPATLGGGEARPGYAYVVSVVAAISGLLFGFDTAVINGALIFMKDQFRWTTGQTEFATSSLLFGCVVGASLAGYATDRFGRKRLLLVSAILFGLSAVGAAVPRDLAEFVVARLVGGVAIGVASLLAPLYIAEIAPASIRGRLVSLNQLAIVSGILLAYFVNWMLALGGSESWRAMFLSAAVPSLAFLIALVFVPESPRWLAEQGREAEALAIIARVSGEEAARRELDDIQKTIAEERGSITELLEPGLRRPLLIAVTLAILQQVTGINTVIYYGSLIFKEQVGAAADSSIGANVIIGFVNLLGTIVALAIIDRVGRKPLLMLASGGMALSLAALGVCFLVQPPPGLLILFVIMTYVAFFAIGLGPGAWVVMAELFPTKIRGRAMSIATVSLWIACVLVAFTFLSLVEAITVSGAFWVYASMGVVTLVFVWKGIPETKGRTLEEIERMWRRP
jgi:sugar porter (SP) family MFS transporter